MRFIMGPGINEVRVLDARGEDITKELHLTELSFNMSTGEPPKGRLVLEAWGVGQHEIEIAEANIEAVIVRRGINNITKLDRTEDQDDADIHPDA